MATVPDSAGQLGEVRRRVAAVHGPADLQQRLRFYDGWAAEYEQDVAALQYQAPRFAASCLAAVFQGPPEDALVLDVACGTGLVAVELQAKGFCRLHGLDGSPGMLERAHHKGLYQELKQCRLGQEDLPVPEGSYDAVLTVGALGVGQVPAQVVPMLLQATKAGGFLCLTTRTNLSNLEYKAELDRLLAELERRGECEKVLVQEVDKWERATSAEEAVQDLDYIPGVVYVYRKSPGPVL
uniref:Methyltransferase like 27 n=1 Tax=Salvator merianae TaxID=96440 RepID=A0A8D0BX67_SALMN